MEGEGNGVVGMVYCQYFPVTLTRHPLFSLCKKLGMRAQSMMHTAVDALARTFVGHGGSIIDQRGED